MKYATILILVLALSAPSAAFADDKEEDEARLAELPMTMPDFRLKDYKENSYTLGGYADKRLVVIFLQINGCPIVRMSFPYLEELRQKYEPTDVAFLMINCNNFDDNMMVDMEAKEFGVEMPILMDHNQTFANALKVRRSAETFVVNPKTHEIIYRGKADDRFDYGLKRPNPKHFWVAEILDGKTPEMRKSVTKGCLMDLVELPESRSYAEQVAPILAKVFGDCAANLDESAARAQAKAIWDSLLLSRSQLPACEGELVKVDPKEAHTLMAWLGNYPYSDSQN
jgi:thiol-disulfide isomerase/thioredoxin